MSSNKTEHYGFPQFLPNDHPDFLTDFNEAFKKIDEELYKIMQAAASGGAESTANSQAIVTINQSITDLTTRVTALENRS